MCKKESTLRKHTETKQVVQGCKEKNITSSKVNNSKKKFRLDKSDKPLSVTLVTGIVTDVANSVF